MRIDCNLNILNTTCMNILKDVSYSFVINFTRKCICLRCNSEVYIYINDCIYTGRFFTFLILTLFSLSQNVMVSHSCSYDMQCTGTEFASTCQNGWCYCQSGYILIGYNCYPGKKVLIGLHYFYN